MHDQPADPTTTAPAEQRAPDPVQPPADSEPVDPTTQPPPGEEFRTSSPTDPQPADRRNVFHGDTVQDEPAEDGPAGPMTRLSEDLNAGRIQPDEALRRLVAGLASSEASGQEYDADALCAAMYPDEYDDEGQPHAAATA